MWEPRLSQNVPDRSFRSFSQITKSWLLIPCHSPCCSSFSLDLTVSFWTLPGFLFICKGKSACDIGWSQHGSSCYLVGESALEFSAAYGTCEKYYASLTTIDSKDEHDFVASLVPAQNLWISFNNREMKNTSTSTSTAKSGEDRVRNWFIGQSKHESDQLCTMIAAVFQSKHNTWVEANCLEQKQFVCEKGELSESATLTNNGDFYTLATITALWAVRWGVFPLPGIVTGPLSSSERNTFPENVVIFFAQIIIIICWERSKKNYVGIWMNHWTRVRSKLGIQTKKLPKKYPCFFLQRT